MDLLIKFWEVLTTENENLTTIIITPITYIECWLICLLAVTILKINCSKKQSLTYIILIFIISLINEFFIPMPYNIILNYLIMFISSKLIFKVSIMKSFLFVIIPTAIFALVGNLVLKPFLIIFNITYQQTETIPIYRILFIFTTYAICFLIVKLIQLRKIHINFLDNFTTYNKRIIILNLLLGIITLSIQLIITFYYINTYSIIFTLLNFISLLAYFSISFYSLTRTMKLQVTTQNLESAENYNTTLSYLYDNVKAFHHDFDNMLFIIGGFIDNNDLEGLKKYYKNLEKDGERVNEIALLNPKTINNSGIYNLLMSKYKKAHDNNVEIHLDFFFDFNRLQMPIYDFSRILGILLDNSIEAAAESKEKTVNIAFRDSSINNTQIIGIKNTYFNTNINTSNIFEKGTTSKENHTGMGLWEVRQLLKRNNNVVLNTSNNEQYFNQTLEIYYKIKE